MLGEVMHFNENIVAMQKLYLKREPLSKIYFLFLFSGQKWSCVRFTTHGHGPNCVIRPEIHRESFLRGFSDTSQEVRVC